VARALGEEAAGSRAAWAAAWLEQGGKLFLCSRSLRF